jgi:hypothetical protein
MAKIEEGKISKWLTAPLRRKRAIATAEKSADKNRKIRDDASDQARQQTSDASHYDKVRKNTNYFDKGHDEAHQMSRTLRKAADKNYETAGITGRRAVSGSRRALRLVQGRKATPFGGLKEEMNPIKAGIKDIQEGRLEQMREKFNDSLARKAAEALQEKKLEVASNYFGQK